MKKEEEEVFLLNAGRVGILKLFLQLNNLR